MTINYCDWINGDDTTGDGSNGNPYKTIDKASIGISGGDEIRCAKSPDDTDLSGELSFENGSVSVTTSIDLSGELSPGDFIYKTGEHNNIQEVISLNSTTLTLYKAYRGTTETVASKKLGVTCTGGSNMYDVVQSCIGSGTSPSLILKISGGWDLSIGTPAQTGKTHFQQLYSTFINRNGYALYIASKKYIEIENLSFLRYNYGLYLDGTDHSFNLINIVCNNNNKDGIHMSNYSKNININNAICNNNNADGIYMESDNIIYSLICNDNNRYGIFFLNIVTSSIINKYSGAGNGSGDIGFNVNDYKPEIPILKMQHFNTKGDNRCYYNYGITYRDTINAKSDQCLRYEPTSAEFYILQEFKFTAQISETKTIKFYIKDDIDFDGDVQAALYFMGIKITGWQTIPTTTDYVQHSLIAQVSDITEDSVLHLKIKVRGATGNVYVDDLGAS